MGRHCLRAIFGNFNTTSRKEGYEEWVDENGHWDPPDPGLGTYRSGHSLDGILCKPGGETPPNFFAGFLDYESQVDITLRRAIWSLREDLSGMG